MAKKILVILLLMAIVFGCAPIEERISIIPSAGVEGIPKNIAIYPLLTTEVLRTIRHHGYRFRPLTTSSGSAQEQEQRIYLVAPAETELKSTLESQMLTGLLSAELSRRGFRLKELPVEVPSEQSEKEKNSFFISLKTLRYMRENYGLEAVLLGNVFFIAERQDPSDIRIRAAYLRLVDTETLDVLCHISLPSSGRGEYMEDTAWALGRALAMKAGLASTEPEK